MYIIWLLNTSDFPSAIHELQLKLPLLLFPLVIGSSPALTSSQLRLMLMSFVAGCIVAVGAGYLALAGFWPVEVDDSRDLSLFVSSIRLSVMVNLGIFIALWLAGRSDSGGRAMRIALLTAAAIMILFLFILLSVTGIILFIIVLGATALYLAVRRKQIRAAIIFSAMAVVVLTASAIMMNSAWSSIRNPENPDLNIPRLATRSGNLYIHNHEETLVENGYLVWVNVCETELSKEWDMRSKLAYGDTDLSGNELRVTLIRYITFLGMVKDSAAIASLTAVDISNIEKGFANPLYARPGNPRAKAYELAWQFDRALKGANPSGHSVTQRIEFYRAAIGIIKRNPWFGTGTGDIRNAFIDEYDRSNSRLTKEYRLRAHNQYLTFAITFGIPGLFIALCLITIPWLINPNRFFYPFFIFILIFFISMFNDDNFGSATSTTFFSYFYTLFLMAENKNDNDNR